VGWFEERSGLNDSVALAVIDIGTAASSGWFNWPGSGSENHVPTRFLSDAEPGAAGAAGGGGSAP
jgi:hypothetical protein